jgi:hypothetical protein
MSDFKVGWREWVSLPELKISAIKAKIDTGARTSALHAFFVEPFIENGIQMVRYGIHPLQHRDDIECICESRVKDYRQVRDSGGHKEMRYVIETDIVLGERRWPIEMTLTNRDRMKFRMLLGRIAMKNFAVYPDKSYLLGERFNHQD